MTILETYTTFIDTLLKLTTEQNCKWDTIANVILTRTANPCLRAFLLRPSSYIHYSANSLTIDVCNSFYVNLYDGFIYLFTILEGYKRHLLLCAQVGVDKNITNFNNEHMLQDELENLHTAICRTLEDRENNMGNFEFIKKIISDHNQGFDFPI